MKNEPKKVYLQIGDSWDGEDPEETDFKELTEVTWCVDRIWPNDLEYVSVKAPMEKGTDEAFELINRLMREEFELRKLLDEWVFRQLGNTESAIEKADEMFAAARDIFYYRL